jgi:hypothetical protein
MNICDTCKQLSEECICDVVRWDLVQHIRQQIQRGTYCTPKRLQMAVDNWLRQEAQGDSRQGL